MVVHQLAADVQPEAAQRALGARVAGPVQLKRLKIPARSASSMPGPWSLTLTVAHASSALTPTETSEPSVLVRIVDEIGDDLLDAQQVRMHANRLGGQLHVGDGTGGDWLAPPMSVSRSRTFF